VKSAIRVTLYNQGQDCSSPNAILVHDSVVNRFKDQLISELENISVGSYASFDTVVGPNTSYDHVVKISKIFKENRHFCKYGGYLNPTTGIIHPTVFEKPLEQANFHEFFAPVFMIHPYSNDSDLSRYFEHPCYYPNAMYISLFGQSNYVLSLIKRGLHTKHNVLRNTDLHIVERGFHPYGGNGPDASCVYAGGRKIPGATLPQREIYFYLVKKAANN